MIERSVGFKSGEKNKNNPAYNRYAAKKANSRLRAAVIAYLGGKCVKCHFTDPRALQVDHIHGGGNKARQGVSWRRYYRQILKGAEGYQLLCANCNWIKRHENGEGVIL